MNQTQMFKSFEGMTDDEVRAISREKCDNGNATRYALAAQEELYQRIHHEPSIERAKKEEAPNYAEWEDTWQDREYIKNAGRTRKRVMSR